jgi:hypothetical protein
VALVAIAGIIIIINNNSSSSSSSSCCCCCCGSSSNIRPILHLRGKEISLLLVKILIYFHVICPLYDDGSKCSTLNNISLV